MAVPAIPSLTSASSAGPIRSDTGLALTQRVGGIDNSGVDNTTLIVVAAIAALVAIVFARSK
jgi:hypothetical protein